MKLLFDPSFLEEAVFLFVTKSGKLTPELQKKFFREREILYDVRGERREALAQDFYAEYFSNLLLHVVFQEALQFFPLIREAKPFVLVKSVWSNRDEGGELYSQSKKKTLVICLLPERVLDTERLRAFLDHELLHISDLLDPHFKHDPELALGGETFIENETIRARLSLLWNIWVEGRLACSRKSFFSTQEERKREFDQVFSHMGETQRARIFEVLSSGKCVTYAELLGFACTPSLSENIQ